MIGLCAGILVVTSASLGKQDSFGSRAGAGLGAGIADNSVTSNNAYGNENQAAGANAGGVLQPVPPSQPSYGTRYARQARYAPGMGSSSKSLMPDPAPYKSSAYPGVGPSTSTVQGPSAAGSAYDYQGAPTGFGGRRLSNGSGGLRNGALVGSSSAGASGGGGYGGGGSALGGGDSLQAMLQHQGSWKTPSPFDSRAPPGGVGGVGDLSSQAASSAVSSQGGMRFGFGRHRVPGP